MLNFYLDDEAESQRSHGYDAARRAN